MTDSKKIHPSLPGMQTDRRFPKLTPAQIERIEKLGSVKSVAAGEILMNVGDQMVRVFVVKEGQVNVIRISVLHQQLVKAQVRFSLSTKC